MFDPNQEIYYILDPEDGVWSCSIGQFCHLVLSDIGEWHRGMEITPDVFKRALCVKYSIHNNLDWRTCGYEMTYHVTPEAALEELLDDIGRELGNGLDPMSMRLLLEAFANDYEEYYEESRK